MNRTPATAELIAAARNLGAIVPPTSWDLTVLPAGGKVLAKWFDAKGRQQCAYSAEAVAERNSRKFAAMLEFGEQLLNIRRAYRADLNSTDARVRACAAIVLIMDETTMRVGGAEYAEENGTYGASSLLKSHVSLEGDTVRFSYVGKHHKSHDKQVQSADLAAVISAFLVSTEGESLFPVNETQVRGYLSAFGATPKMWRTYHATRVADETLAAMGAPANEKQAKANIAKAMIVVSQMLGNSPAMARSSYVNPAVLADYAAQCGR